MYHRQVSKNTVNNPIARAVAQKALKEAVRDQKIKLYLTEEDAPCIDFCGTLSMTFSAITYAATLDRNIGLQHPLVKIVRGGMSACHQMAESDRFKRINIVSIEQALDSAVELNAELKPESVSKAWNKILKDLQ